MPELLSSHRTHHSLKHHRWSLTLLPQHLRVRCHLCNQMGTDRVRQGYFSPPPQGTFPRSTPQVPFQFLRSTGLYNPPRVLFEVLFLPPSGYFPPRTLPVPFPFLSSSLAYIIPSGTSEVLFLPPQGTFPQVPLTYPSRTLRVPQKYLII